MKKFTVVLLYPDYVSDGIETYQANIRAKGPKSATWIARKNASKNVEVESKDDFKVIAIYEGDHQDLYDGSF